MLGRKAILVPTPGQTEQEYLAKHLQEQGVFYSVPQKNFVLEDALGAAQSFPFHSLLAGNPFDLFAPVIDSWLQLL